MAEQRIGEHVRRWRVIRGLSQAEVARRAGLSRLGVQKIEKGLSAPRAATLHKLALALDVRLSDLMRPVSTPKGVRFRAHKKMARRDNVLAEVSLLLDDLNELEQITGDKVPYRLRRLTEELVSIPPGRERAILAAERTRSELGLSREEPIRDICGLIEAAGIKLVLVRLSSDGFFGLSVSEESGGPAIVVNVWERISVERWIFTTAHELGHLLLHVDAYDVDKVEEDGNEEKEANVFASHFLMPEPVFSKEWEEARGLPLVDRVFKMKRMFHVSYRTVLFRLIENGTYDTTLWRRFHGAYRTRTGKSLSILDEPAALSADFFLASNGLASEEPERLTEADFVPERKHALVRRALEDGLISLGRAAELLRLDLSQMRQLVAGWQT